MKNKYLVFDLETTVTHSFKRFGNPFDDRNKVIVVATILQNEDPVVLYDKGGIHQITPVDIERCNFLVGHNIKYDLLYAWQEPQLQAWLQQGGRIIDTMTAEYLLTAQESVYASLDSLSEKYGGELKDDKIGQYFKAGFGADEIDPGLLLPYAEGDVMNTEIILNAQMKEAKKKQMMPIILAYMEHYLAICEMESNGLYFNLDKAQLMRKEYEQRLEVVTKQFITCANKYWTIPCEFNPGSQEHVSAVLFNSCLSVIEDVEVLGDDGKPLVYGPKAQKAGQIKTRKEKVEYKNKGLGLSLRYTKPTRKAGVYAVDDKVLSDIKEEKAHEFIALLREYRETTKFLNTYLYGRKYKNKEEYEETGLIPLVMPKDGCIHHTLDTVQTKTGRLNSKNPNGQNIPRDLLQLFTSRFGDEGQIVAIDYSQLEVRVQAYLAQCPQMIKDIKDGVDFHCLRLSYAEDKPYEEVVKLCQESEEWALKRKKAKVISFQKAYGAAPMTLARTTGLPLETVEKIFQKEDERYPEVKQYYEDVQAEIKRKRIPTDRLIFMRDKRSGDTVTRDGEYQGVGYYRSITGKRYHFLERAVVTVRGDIFRYFSQPDICNFMVQGTAADIVSMQVGRLFRFLLDKRDRCLLINEVHDEVVLDIKKEAMEELLPQIKEILEDVDGSFQKLFGVKFNVPITVDVSSGDSWYECK